MQRLEIIRLWVWCATQVFFLGDWGSPFLQKFCQSPHPTLVTVFLDPGLSLPAEVRPQKVEKFKYIFVANLTTFKLKSTLKSCISCLKIAKNGLFCILGGQDWLLSDFFSQVVPPSDFVPIGDQQGTKILSPPIKNLEKNPATCRLALYICEHNV